VTVTVPATDADGNLVAESLTWGDGETPNIASFDPTGARKSTFSHTYTDTGLYRIAASARDALGATASSRGADCLMVVYGAADAAKGRGWISSPAGAFKQDASIAGKATFGECVRRPLAQLAAQLRALDASAVEGRRAASNAAP
jgi:hypothetical protein